MSNMSNMSNMSPMTSIYIPFVDSRFNERDVITTFDYYNICNVSRVDFVEIPEKTNVCHAFVHVNNWYNSNNAAVAFWEITNKGSYKFYYSQSQMTSNAFWLLLPNKNPIPKTKLNIHQLAVMISEMEKKMTEQQAEMDEMRKRIADLELTSVYVADKVDSMDGSTRKHTFWKNDSDIGVADEDDYHDDVINTAFISDDEDDEYDDVPDLIECSDSDSADDEHDDDTYGYVVC
jgi:hypothetical protein